VRALGGGPFGLLLSPLALVLAAAVLGLLAPSDVLARRSDLILAALVLAVSLTITPERLRAARGRLATAALLAVVPPLLLVPLSVGLGRLFAGPERDGLIALGLAPTEVACVGLVALARGNAPLGLLVVVLSFVVTLVAAPLLAPPLTGEGADAGELAVRFSLVLALPLLAGVAARAGGRLAGVERAAEPAASVLLALLVYAALGELESPSGLGEAALAAGAFLAASLVLLVPIAFLAGEPRTAAFLGPFRDFAVAAALALQVGAEGAASVAAVYGVLMLIVASATASLLRRRPALRR
jgi:predicted Na+-dependent transporter